MATDFHRAWRLGLATTLAFIASGATARHGPDRWFTALPTLGWTLVDASDEVALFYKPPIEKQPGGLLRVLTRWEENPKSQTGPAVSLVGLQEIDCNEKRSRFIKVTTYSAANMAGTASVDETVKGWSYDSAASLGGELTGVVCETR